jgi:hypothetical protein
MPAPKMYPQEPRERAMRLVQEVPPGDPELSLNVAVVRIGQLTAAIRALCGAVQSRPRSSRDVDPGGTTVAAPGSGS